MIPPGWLSSRLFMWSVGSVVSAILMILLLLLCLPFKRNKQQLSPTMPKRNEDTSELISMTKLEDHPNPEDMTLREETSKKGRPLSSRQAEKETNGLSAGFEQENAASAKDGCTAGPNQQSLEKSGKSDLDHLGISGAHPSCPPAPSPRPMQFRKLPLTPKEAHISKMEPQNQSTDSQVYECIEDEKVSGLSIGDEPAIMKGCGPPTGPISATAGDALVETGRKDTTPCQSVDIPVQVTAVKHCSEETQETRSPNTDTDAERRLSAMYARVCKRPKASQGLQPKSHSKTTEPEEEEPPPIPEKHFENIYESLNLEGQGVEMPNAEIPPEA